MTTRRNHISLHVIPEQNRGHQEAEEGSGFGVEGSTLPVLDAAPPRFVSQLSAQPLWRSLDELANTPEFEEYLHREFPDNASEWTDPVGRRQFLKLMAASLSLAGLASCTRQPSEKIVPYVRPPEQIVQGKPLMYASAMPLGGVGVPVVVKSHMGRPIKIEGNELHPASLGGSDVFAQASILGLYDPDRSRTVLNLGQISTWSAFIGALNIELEAQRTLSPKGAGLRLLTPTVTSPTLAAQIKALLAAFPGAKWHQYDPVGSENALAGTRLAFGTPLQPIYHLDKADVIVALDADFLCYGPGGTRYARDYAARRRPHENDGRMNRLYAVESAASNTGANADHRLRLRPQDIETLAQALAARLGVPGVSAPKDLDSRVEAIAKDILAHKGATVIIAGDHQPPIVHALAQAMNAALGSVGQTVTYIQPLPAVAQSETGSLPELTKDIAAGQVRMLVILGCNPMYDAPADLGFRELMTNAESKVPFRVHLGLYADETAQYCHWHVPAAHYLESWGDVRAYDGTISLIQPLIAPLYNGRTELELIAALLGATDRSAYEIVRDYWKSNKTIAATDFEKVWQTALHDGLFKGTAFEPQTVKLREDFANGLSGASQTSATMASGLSIVFRPDPSVRDGQFANNAWLQELPDPLTKLTWDNAALLSPTTAQRLGLANEDVVELKYRGRSVNAPVLITPGQADDCVVLHLGYGRRRVGQVGNAVGFDAYSLRTSTAPWFDTGLELTKTGQRHRLAVTQDHHSIEGRAHVRFAELEEYHHHPDFAQHAVEKPPADMTLYPQPNRQAATHAWGMAIDLNTCTGCNACVVACQSENNIPVVGKEQVLNNREMHWLRIDRYYQGEPSDPQTYHQPLACVHCEYAPCEVVCPVAATVHSVEGLNEMVYNRCVGTRYCSNNCPYKVRRFNFLQYNDLDSPVLKLMRNPDVTVRTRGVMEKCTYCVQRINGARIQAQLEDRPMRRDEVVTACQGACPTQAIVFGDLNDPESRVSRLKANPLSYGVLEENNTRPRTSHLAKVWNPNPELVEKRDAKPSHGVTGEPA